jgi:hypothetical protein
MPPDVLSPEAEERLAKVAAAGLNSADLLQ